MTCADGDPPRLGRRGEVRGSQADVVDRAAVELEAVGERVELEVVVAPLGAGQRALPELPAQLAVGRREVQDEAQPPHERGVHVALQVRGQDGDAVVGLEPLEQVADLDVRVAVVRVLDLGAAAEERVGLVEQQQAVAGLDLVEDLRERLLGLADVLRDDLAEVDAVEVEPELVRQAAGGERLAGARLAGQQAGQAGARSGRPTPTSMLQRTRWLLRCHATISSSWSRSSSGTTRSDSRADVSMTLTWRPMRRAPCARIRPATASSSSVAVLVGVGRGLLQVARLADRAARLLDADAEPRRHRVRRAPRPTSCSQMRSASG